MIWARVEMVGPENMWSVDTSFKATGIGHVLRNKGGVAVALRYNYTRFAFVCAHLEAHEGREHAQRRDTSIYDIFRWGEVK